LPFSSLPVTVQEDYFSFTVVTASQPTPGGCYYYSPIRAVEGAHTYGHMATECVPAYVGDLGVKAASEPRMLDWACMTLRHTLQLTQVQAWAPGKGA
jgi:hypothetical protein